MSEHIVAGVGVAVGADVSSPARKARKLAIETTLRTAVEQAIADGERAGTGFPSDAVLRQVQADALERFKQAHG
jgi:hypothetical protein